MSRVYISTTSRGVNNSKPSRQAVRFDDEQQSSDRVSADAA
jgi:hypothetical protein